MLGFYENFPENYQWKGSFLSLSSTRKIQRNILKKMSEINNKTFYFEEIINPTLGKNQVKFEFGIAENGKFFFIDEQEIKKIEKFIQEKIFSIIDLFCGIRYYKIIDKKRRPLKFDYYLIRVNFRKENSLEFRVFHERGPRYITPDELITYLVYEVNKSKNKNILISDNQA